jgi:hypothetical protein
VPDGQNSNDPAMSINRVDETVPFYSVFPEAFEWSRERSAFIGIFAKDLEGRLDATFKIWREMTNDLPT